MDNRLIIGVIGIFAIVLLSGSLNLDGLTGNATAFPGWSHCNLVNQCGQGEGDCDNDNECQTGLRCVDNTGARSYGSRYGSVDTCEPIHNGTTSQQTSTRTGVVVHKGCNAGNQCVTFVGSGPDTCSTDNDCVSGSTGGDRLNIFSATYGGSSSSRVNFAQHIGRACNGKSFCSYTIDHKLLGDPVPGVAKNYAVTYGCGSGTNTKRVDAEASGKRVFLSCNDISTTVPIVADRAPASAKIISDFGKSNIGKLSLDASSGTLTCTKYGSIGFCSRLINSTACECNT